MPKIFISYRRADSAAISGRIYDHLARRFNPRNVFKDVNNIAAGANFLHVIEEWLERSDILLVIIGPRWAKTTDGQSLLANPADYVRSEIETGLRLGLAIMPILVDGATMPAANDLPAGLHPIVHLHAASVRNDPDFKQDIQRLTNAIQSLPLRRRPVVTQPKAKRQTPRWRRPVTYGAVALLIVALVVAAPFAFSPLSSLLRGSAAPTATLSVPPGTLQLISLPYSAKAPGCDKRYWSQPATNHVTCSATGMTLTGTEPGDAVGVQQVANTVSSYTINITVSNITGGAALALNVPNGTWWLTLVPHTQNTDWAIHYVPGSGAVIRDSIAAASTYKITLSADGSRTTSPSQYQLSINGQTVLGYDTQTGYSLPASPFTYLTFSLYRDDSVSSSITTETATFSDLRITVP